MTRQHDLRDELRETFVAELEERLASMNEALLALERPVAPDVRRRLVESLLRDAHTLKGGAQLVEWEPTAGLAHALESHLAQLREADGELDLAPVFAAIDALGRIHAGEEPSNAEFEALAEALTEGASRSEPAQGTLGLQAASGLADEPDALASGAGASGDRVGDQADRRGSVRVATERLDRLIARAGDLLTARDVSRHQRHRLRRLAHEIGAWHDEWQAVRAAARLTVDGDQASAATLRALLDGIDGVGERTDQVVRDARGLAGEVHVSDQRFGQVVDQLEAELLDLRMVPARTLFRQFPRMVRDLGGELDKNVEVNALGWDTPMDRDLLERLREPLLHLLRNAVDHGIEPADERKRRGKPPMGTITVEAGVRAGSIVIEVRDDGAGIDRERVVERAAAAGLADHAADLDDALTLVFTSGFSTSTALSRVSGRGVGLDVVASAVAALRGTVRIASELGLGTSFTLTLPLSLASTRVLVVVVGGERFAVPIASIDRVVRADPSELITIGGRTCLATPQGSVILAELGAAVGVAPREVSDASRVALLVNEREGGVGIVVDEVAGEREVVVKEIGLLAGRVPLVQGAAVVERDEVLPVLDPRALAEWARGGQAVHAAPSARREGPREADRALRILVVDDSLTTRTLEKNILAAAGFDVALAADGQEALLVLRLESFDLVVSDVDMPIVDGIELTERIRGDAALHDVPVILVTAKEEPADRERGLRAGADLYLPKSQFDHQALLAAIGELVG